MNTDNATKAIMQSQQKITEIVERTKERLGIFPTKCLAVFVDGVGAMVSDADNFTKEGNSRVRRAMISSLTMTAAASCLGHKVFEDEAVAMFTAIEEMAMTDASAAVRETVGADPIMRKLFDQFIASKTEMTNANIECGVKIIRKICEGIDSLRKE